MMNEFRIQGGVIWVTPHPDYIVSYIWTLSQGGIKGSCPYWCLAWLK